ncbi:unnamed protein product [Polarella glacialis]|uniref:6-phosphofructo-2-kinase domain-containing protein n=1 Tax=Polarella glacialis TaxID=89957 RepID=A0A813L5U2_POLGL|nr:unnamed protein product [Polarella glacialis]CAE8715883.1 unnamed protein product [Polarella glacialis]
MTYPVRPALLGSLGAAFAALLLFRLRKKKLAPASAHNNNNNSNNSNNSNSNNSNNNNQSKKPVRLSRITTPELLEEDESENYMNFYSMNERAPRNFYSMNPMHVVREPVVIAMVGLPARGKSYMSKAIIRYLTFLGCPARLFNAGSKRRDRGLEGADASFFDSGNADAKRQREKIAMDTLDELLEWLRSETDGCACGIFDATNTTVARRKAVMARCAQESPPVRLVFLESICNDEIILQNNYQMKLGNDDYRGAEAAQALQDFLQRVHEYEKVYEPITDEEAIPAATGHKNLKFRYLQTINAGQKMVTAGCDGYIMSQLLPLLHSVHLGPRKVSIVLAGESENDRQGFRGGDSCLSEAGLRYSRVVSRLMKQREATHQPAHVWTGSLQRYSQLTDMLCDTPRMVIKVKVLDELCFGSLEGLACGYMRHSLPEEHAKREADKLHYRYPGAGGESYMDMVLRLRDCVQAFERVRRDVIVVCDVAVARALLGYFQGIPIAEIPDLEVSPGIIELTRSHSGFQVSSLQVEEGDVSLLAKRH